MDVIPADPRDMKFHITMLDLYGWADRVPERFRPEDKIPFELEGYRKKITESIPRLGLQRMQRIEDRNRKRGSNAKEGLETLSTRDWGIRILIEFTICAFQILVVSYTKRT